VTRDKNGSNLTKTSAMIRKKQKRKHLQCSYETELLSTQGALCPLRF
jgi:hypothetical protein